MIVADAGLIVAFVTAPEFTREAEGAMELEGLCRLRSLVFFKHSNHENHESHEWDGGARRQPSASGFVRFGRFVVPTPSCAGERLGRVIIGRAKSPRKQPRQSPPAERRIGDPSPTG